MRLLLAGNDITVIALWLGHEQVSTTNIYLHADLDDEFPTVAEVASILKLNQQTIRNWIDQGSLAAPSQPGADAGQAGVGWRVGRMTGAFDAGASTI